MTPPYSEESQVAHSEEETHRVVEDPPLHGPGPKIIQVGAPMDTSNIEASAAARLYRLFSLPSLAQQVDRVVPEIGPEYYIKYDMYTGEVVISLLKGIRKRSWRAHVAGRGVSVSTIYDLWRLLKPWRSSIVDFYRPSVLKANNYFYVEFGDNYAFTGFRNENMMLKGHPVRAQKAKRKGSAPINHYDDEATGGGEGNGSDYATGRSVPSAQLLNSFPTQMQAAFPPMFFGPPYNPINGSFGVPTDNNNRPFKSDHHTQHYNGNANNNFDNNSYSHHNRHTNTGKTLPSTVAPLNPYAGLNLNTFDAMNPFNPLNPMNLLMLPYAFMNPQFLANTPASLPIAPAMMTSGSGLELAPPTDAAAGDQK